MNYKRRKTRNKNGFIKCIDQEKKKDKHGVQMKSKLDERETTY